jgi:hypothetical protein
MNYGSLSKPKYILREIVGKAKLTDDEESTFTLEFGINPLSKNPIVMCKESGLCFSIGWESIVKLAVESGKIGRASCRERV